MRSAVAPEVKTTFALNTDASDSCMRLHRPPVRSNSPARTINDKENDKLPGDDRRMFNFAEIVAQWRREVRGKMLKWSPEGFDVQLSSDCRHLANV